MVFKNKKLIRINFLLILVLGIIPRINSQNIDGICTDVAVFGEYLENGQVIYQKYTPKLKLNKRYSSFEEVKNNTPEELIISQMSVQDNDWLSHNFGEKMQWSAQQLERTKNQDYNKNYLELTRKVTFSYNKNDYAIIRVNVYDERREKPTVVSLMSKYQDGRWILLKNKFKSSIEFFMMNLNLDSLDAIFENGDSGNLTFNEIIRSSWSAKVLSTSIAYSKIGNSMSDNDDNLNSIYQRNNVSIRVTTSFEIGYVAVVLFQTNIRYDQTRECRLYVKVSERFSGLW